MQIKVVTISMIIAPGCLRCELGIPFRSFSARLTMTVEHVPPLLEVEEEGDFGKRHYCAEYGCLFGGALICIYVAVVAD